MSTYRRIAAVDLAARILEFIANAKGPVSGQAVAEGLGVAHGTVMCHLVTLEDRRFLVRLGGDHFELGTAVANLWARKKTQLESAREKIDRELQSIQ